MSPEIIDREEELDALEKEFQRESSFVVVYGRRRIGKTRLIQEFLKGKGGVYFLATEEGEAQNRDSLRREIACFTGNPLLAGAPVEDWSLVFEAFLSFEPEKKKVIAIDEFQYLCYANQAFPSLMQKIWDTQLSGKKIMLILCGSFISMMESQVLAYSSPLYGRRTAQIRLRQIPFRYYGGFFPGKKPAELVPFYAVTGGVPKYIEALRAHKNVYEAIAKDVLSRMSFLYEEPHFLLSREVVQVGSYFSIIKTIAAGKRKLVDIASTLGVKQTGLTRYLATLTSMDIIEREVPVTEEHPEKSRRGLYRITDNFMLFWFKFIYPNIGVIEAGGERIVLQKIRQNLTDALISFVYEDICREELRRAELGKKPYSWNFRIDRAGRWWDRYTEIDIVAFDSEGFDIIFCECKYTKKPLEPEVLFSLEEKSLRVEWKRAQRRTHYVLFSRSGFSPQLEALTKKRKDIALVTL
ncbi:MAG: ATP-binding protein [Spirochaetales bacterium]|jgi:AAA+ ATPase superfamily predicted ATPase|nr:ATP-binding protein [Spirochaetales bacterium]